MKTLNEFVKELNDRAGIEKPVAIVLAQMYDIIIEQQRELDMCGSVLLELTRVVKGFVILSEATNYKIKQLQQFGKTSGVDVHSVINDPEDNKH